MKHLTALALTVSLALAPTPASAHDTSHMTGRCRQYEPLLRLHAPKGGWDVTRMSRIMYRESRCLPAIVNRRGRDTGLLQFHPITWSFLSTKFGVPRSSIQSWLKVPANNVRAGAALFRFARRAWGNGYQPWAVR